MANDILAEIGSSTLMTITLNALANSAGRQSTLIAQSTNPVQPRARVIVAVMAGSSAPTAYAVVEVRKLVGNGQVRCDNVGASDAAYPAITGIMNADLLGSMAYPTTPVATTDQLVREFVLEQLGKEWGIAIYNRSGNALGTNLILTPDFAADTNWTKGTGWTITAGVGRAAAGSASDLSQTTPPLTSGRYYLVTFTISNYSAGTITPKCGTQAGTARSANGTYTEVIVANGTGFLFSKDSSFAGDIDNVTVAGNFVAYEYEHDEIQ